MIFILNKQEKVVNILRNGGGANEAPPFFDDIYSQDLATGAETFTFSTIAISNVARDLVVGNYVAFKNNEGEYKLFQITQTEEHHEDAMYMNVYAEGAGLELINKVFRARKSPSTSLRKFMEMVLSETGWNVGAIPLSVQESLDLDLEDATVYATLQNNLSKYGVEMAFRCEINNGRISSKFVDLYIQRGRVTGKRFAFGRDIEGIRRKVDSTELFTALIGKGNKNISFKDVTVDGINKPLGQDFVADQEAYDRYNNNGYHIIGIFNYDTESPEELLRETYKQLQKCKEPKIEYEVSVALLGELLGESWNKVSIGDTVSIVDNAFNPPIHLMARVSKLDKSFTNNQSDTCTLSNFVEVQSNISDSMRKIASQLEGYIESKFPIGSEDIQEGAVDGTHMNQAYMSKVTADIVKASLVEAEKVIANEIQASEGRFENIVTDKITATEGKFNEIITEKIEAVDAKFETVEADIVNTNKIVAGLGEFDTVIAGKVEAVEGSFSQLKADVIKANNIIAGKVEAVEGEFTLVKSDVAEINNIISGNISSGNIQTGGITGDNLNMDTIFVEDANIINVNADKITSGKVNTNNVTIESENGGIVIADNTQQFKDKNGKVRVQIGQDTKGDFNFGVFDETGTGVLIDATGVKEKALADGIIKDRMIGQGEINGSKIDIDSLITEVNKDTNTTAIKGSKILLDTKGQKLDVAFNSLKTQADKTKKQTESNTTQIGVEQGRINTLIQDTTITKDGQTVKLKDEYSKLEQTVGGIKTSVGQQQTTIDEHTGKIIATESKVGTLEQSLNGFSSELSHVKTTVDKQEEAIGSVNSALSGKANSSDVYKKNETMTTSAINSAINQSANSIKLGISETYETKTNVETKVTTTLNSAKTYADTKKSEAISTASTDATNKVNSAKNELNTAINKKANSVDVYKKSETYTKSETDSKINIAKDSIELGVKNTYETKTNVENKISTAVSKIQIGGRNLAYKETIKPFSSSTLALAEYVKNGKLILTRPTGNGDGGFYFDKLIKYKKNTKYIVHFYMTCTKYTIKNIHFHNGQKLVSTKIYIDDVYVGTIGTIDTSVFDDGLPHKVRMEYTTPSTLVDSSAGVNQTYFQPNKGLPNNTYTVVIEEFMVEEGTKTGSWTPAPEDVDLAIDKKANIVDVYKKSETYTKSETDSKINVAKDEITLGVSNTYETKSNVTTKVNDAISGIKIGGRNYAINTKIESVQAGNNTINQTNTLYSFYLNELLGREITVSFDWEVTGTTTSGLFYVQLNATPWTAFSDTISVSSSNKKGKTSKTFIMPTSSATSTLMCRKDNFVGTLTISNFKIEIGNKATDWSPAPEDVQASIDLKAEKTDVYSKSEVYTKTQTDSAINVAKDSINLGVSQTYETKTNVTSKVNTAKTEAINTSKSYADTKKSEAISTASTDATNKVNSAKTELKTKIDGIQVGGRNLFLKSNIDQHGLGNWIGNGGGVGKVEGTFIDGTKTIKVTGSSGIQYNSFIKLKRNTTYVYSMMMKSSGSMIVNSSNPLHMWLNTSETGGQHLEKVISTSGKIEANKWTKVWVVFETPNTQDVYYMKPFVYGIDTNTVYISKVQIEEGTKPTDWTPAPEDIDSLIGTKANKTDVYAKSEVYTKAQTDSAIKVAKDEINLGVKNTYETKSNVESKVNSAVNNVQIGGRNLAIGTSDSWKSASGFSGETNYCVFRHVINTKTLSVGDRLTVSFMFKCENLTNNNTARVIRVQGSGDVTGWNSGAFNSYNIPLDYSKPTQEIKINYTITITADHLKNSKWNINFRTDYITGGTIYLKELLAEKGTKASSWTPAPEDVDSAINKKANIVDVYKKSETYTKSETDSAIKVAKDNINLSVSNTYETKTNVTNKINSANTTTLNSAKSYADTKKTEAINSANSSTDTKLKSYSTTTQMNSAIQVAKDSITNTVSSTYAKKADVESTYATKSSLTQTANNITASFKATGGYNLIANSTGYNGTNLWSSTGATMGTTIYNHIGGATNKYMYLDNGTKTTESFAFSKRFKLKANTKYTLSGWFHNFTKCPNFDVFLLSSTAVAEDVTDTSYTNTQLLIKAQNTSGSWKKFSITFTTPANVISGYLRIDNNGYDSSGTNSNRVHWSALMLNEGEEQPWSPHPNEVYSGSTIIDASGITINNGALRVKNNAGTTVLSGDSNGNLDITGTVKSQKGNMYVSLDYGGLTFQSARNNEQLLRMETTSFTSDKSVNGVDFNLAKHGEYISFNHINKENLNNGWSSSDGSYNFMDFWSKDTTLGSKTYKKGINVNSPMYVNKGLKLYSGTNFYADIDGSISWNNGTGTVSNLLGLYGDNGAILGYKSGESLNARFLVSEASQPGTGDNLISWGNYNFNGYTFHNANIVAKSLSVQGSKNCLQETKNYGSRLINAYETAEYYFGDIGFGQINEEGVCYIDIDDVFLECVNTDAQYHVFTQTYNGKITSIERYKTYFIVKGEQNTEFSWELKAKRKGYENNRLDTQPIDIDAVDSGLELFSDSDLNAITSENILTNVLDFNLENILLTEE